MHPSVAAFAELPWDTLWKASVTLAAVAVLLVLTSKVLLEIVRRAIGVLFFLLAVVGSYYTWIFVKDYGLLNSQNWYPYWLIISDYAGATSRSDLSYLDQIKHIGQNYWQQIRL
jgi:hypothetical protein